MYDPTQFNVDPYYDDYSQGKKFLKLLFRPGYAVQARELTQLQTLLQSQINRFGDHVFRDGSIVQGGEINDTRIKFARVSGLSGTSDISDFDNLILTSDITGGASARVLYTSSGLSGSSFDNSTILFYDYVSGGTGFTAGTTLSATLNATTLNATIAGLSGVTGSAIGDAVLVGVNSGIRYVDGFFVYHDSQKIAAYNITGSAGNEYRVFDSVNTKIGFDVSKEFVSNEDDDTLTDPAFGSYNFGAPGADRYKIDLSITQYEFSPSLTATTDNFSRENFIEFIRILDGETIKKEIYSDYGVIEETLARRTYDESGNYTVRPFDLFITPSGTSADQLVANLDPGKAYVFGHEFETQSVSKLALDRARGSSHRRSVSNQLFNRNVGPYTVLQTGYTANAYGVTFDFSTQPVVYLGNTTGAAAFSRIGSARLRNVFSDNSASLHRVYLYDIDMTGSFNFGHTKSVYLAGHTAAGQQIFETAAGTTATLYNSAYNNLLFDIPNGPVYQISDVDYNVYTFNRVNFASGATAVAAKTHLSFALPSSIGTFPSPEVSVYSSDGRSLAGQYSLTGTSLQVVLSATGATTSYVVARENVTSLSTIRTKTLTKETVTLSDPNLRTDENGNLYLAMNKLIDVFVVNGISGNAGSGITDMTSYFTLDNGQRDNYYDWSRLLLKSNIAGYTGFTGPYQVNLERFAHSGFGPFVVNSYSASVTSDNYLGYDSIPEYVNSSGRTSKLRDVFDFRPSVDSAGNMTGCFIPTDTTDNNFDYSHYLGRSDKIVLTRDRNFKIIRGVPDLNPIPPSDDPDAMTLYVLSYNPYTLDETDLTTRYIENKRFTMKDIGNIEKRLDAVEYYTTLGILEQDAKNTAILDSEGLQIPKLGILVDTFRGHNIGDVLNESYNSSIDFEQTSLRPRFANRMLEKSTTDLLSNVSQSQGIYTTDYSLVPFINQPLASAGVTINPLGIFNYLGSLSLSPSSDFWFDTSTDPLVKINIDGENDAWASGMSGHGFGTQWNDWESNWNGIQLTDNSGKNNRSGIERETSLLEFSSVSNIANRSVPQSIRSTSTNRVVSKNVIPNMRSRTITINAEGLKPSTRMYAFFDDTDVSSYCTGTLTTDSYGKITGLQFSLPAGLFRTGQRLFRLTDSSTNTVASTTTAAEAIYQATGLLQDRDDTIVSTRSSITRRENVRSESIVSNIFTRNNTRNETNIFGSYDPVAQTFRVDSGVYSAGLFVKKLNLYFKSKESQLNTPVVVQLRPTINGYPHPSKIIPFSEVYVYPSAVTTSTDATSATEFAFSAPVYLPPGEYAICVLSSSNNYELFTGQIGAEPIGQTDQRISKDVYTGTLFKPRSDGSYESTELEDLTFTLQRCSFSTSGSLVFGNKTTTAYGNAVYAHTYRLNTEQILPPGTSITWSETGILSSPSATSINPNVNITINSDAPGAAATKNPNSTITSLSASFAGTEQVSPVFDSDRCSIYLVENLVSNTAPASTHYDIDDNSTSKYITKTVSLADGIEGTNLHVFLHALQQNETSIKVYAKFRPVGTSLTFDNLPWNELTAVNGQTSDSNDDYLELKYTLSADTDAFEAFAVKIVLLSSTGSIVPIVKNMRAIVV